jgi:hypothetical protein
MPVRLGPGAPCFDVLFCFAQNVIELTARDIPLHLFVPFVVFQPWNHAISLARSSKESRSLHSGSRPRSLPKLIAPPSFQQLSILVRLSAARFPGHAKVKCLDATPLSRP